MKYMLCESYDTFDLLNSCPIVEKRAENNITIMEISLRNERYPRMLISN